jgi:hypothetical protein
MREIAASMSCFAATGHGQLLVEVWGGGEVGLNAQIGKSALDEGVHGI